MSLQTPLPDPHGDVDPFFPRYRAAISRGWLFIALVALVAGLAAAVFVGGPSHVVGVRISVDHAPDAVLTPVELDEAVGDVPGPGEVRGVIQSFDAPDRVTVTATGDDSVVLSVQATSEDEAREIADHLISEVSDFVRTRRAQVATSVAAGVDGDAALLQQQIAELDAKLAAEPNEQLRDVYLYERQNAVDDLALANRRANALDLWPTSDATVVTAFQPEKSTNSRVVWFVIGLIGGAIVALVLVLVRAHLDRRVWTRSDVGAHGVGPIWPIVPDDGPDRAVALASIRHLARASATGGALTVVATDARSDRLAAGIADAIDPQLEVVDVGSLHEALSATSGPVVLVVSIGGTRTDDVVRGVEYVEGLGGHVAGVVLGGVGSRGARRADS